MLFITTHHQGNSGISWNNINFIQNIKKLFISNGIAIRNIILLHNSLSSLSSCLKVRHTKIEPTINTIVGNKIINHKGILGIIIKPTDPKLVTDEIIGTKFKISFLIIFYFKNFYFYFYFHQYYIIIMQNVN